MRRPISEVDFSLVPGATQWEAFAAALHFAPSATRARSLRSLPLAALGARLAFPGQGRFASKHAHRAQRKERDEQGRVDRKAHAGPRSWSSAPAKTSATCVSRSTTGARPRYIDLVAFGEQAESSAAEFEKGSKVEAKGSLRYSEWEVKPKGKAKGTEKRSKHSVIVRELVAA